jgi:hypothetical protein
MSRPVTSILWLLTILLLSALVLQWLEGWEEQQVLQPEVPALTHATVMLVGYEGETYPGIEASGSYLRVGCNDVLIPTEIPVVSRRLPSILSALTGYQPPQGLHNPLRDVGLSFVRLDQGGGEEVIVHLAGQISLGGICDVPRLKAQIEETIRIYREKFEVLLNDSASAYRCLGDESGRCK